MQAYQIARAWDAYRASVMERGEQLPQAEANDPVAQLFGVDEFKLDRAGGRIKFLSPNFVEEWLPLEGPIDPEINVPWAAFITQAADHAIVLGTTGSPFDPEMLPALPSKKGILLAVPNVVMVKFLAKQK